MNVNAKLGSADRVITSIRPIQVQPDRPGLVRTRHAQGPTGKFFHVTIYRLESGKYELNTYVL